MKALIPTSPDAPGGPFAEVDGNQFELLGTRDKTVLVEFNRLPDEVKWFDTYDLMYCQTQHDGHSIKIIRAATDEERVLFRVPLWIQGEQVPECCGRPMFFIGQIDDDRICTEPPEGAKMWWHDKASFYVFTCSQCLKCRAIGQQM
jgi:hypothetical protein